MTAQILMLHIRVDDDVKDRATLAFNAMGLFVSNAVRQFLRGAVVDQASPLQLKVPNAEMQFAMRESRSMMASRKSRFAFIGELFADLEKNSGNQARQRPARL